MGSIGEKYEKEIEKILDRERWQGYVSGKVEGALNVLFAFEIDKEERIRRLAEAVGLCSDTAKNYVELREKGRI